MKINFNSFLLALGLLAGVYGISNAQKVTSPKEHFGFNIGDDYKLANFTQMDSYFRKLAAESDRVEIRPIGMTEEGREQYIMVISSPENLKNVDRYKAISQQVGRAEGLTDEEAKKLSKQGKPIVWIDGGMHSNETVGSHQLVEMYYQLLNRTDEEVLNILDNVVILMCHINPDGQELIADWYMQEEDPTKRNMSIPRLYQKYVGHDNNRDYYMNNLKETTNVSLQLYVEWLPQIVYNHHQTSPRGTIVAGPPYRDPFNHVLEPLLITGIDGVGAAMINRLNQEGKPGYTRLGGSVFSTWWNGGLRTTPYYHNMIGILTETYGGPTPMEVPLVPDRLIPDNNTPYPIAPQKWHFRQSIDYSLSMNYAILDYAIRFGDQLLYNFYIMGRNGIAKGSQDSWTRYPKWAEQLKELAKNHESALPSKYFAEVYGDHDNRDPRGYIIPADQTDFTTAVKFLNSLIKSGVQVEVATTDFSFGGKSYPKGSYIVKAGQAFRPHVLDMFEPQNHPNDFQYPGGPPVRPYDAAGWTLAIQMGVEYDRIYNELTGPFEKLPLGQVLGLPAYSFVDSKNGYLLDVAENNAFAVVNELLKSSVTLSRVTQSDLGVAAGSFFVPASAKNTLRTLAEKHGVRVYAAAQNPKNAVAIKPARVALFDYYGGSMPSGWTRWLLEQFNYSFQLVYPNDINAGNLASQYDVILFIGDGLPDANGNTATLYNRHPAKERVPAQFHAWMGTLDKANSVPKIKSFIEAGGRVITVGNNSNLAYHLDLPVVSQLLDPAADGENPLPGDKFYVPSSILQSKVNTSIPAAWGMDDHVSVMYNNNPVFKINSSASTIEPILWFGDEKLLLSGWAWGENYLHNGVSAFKADIGKGTYYAFGPEILYRAQAHGTFKLLFNQLYR